jgi:hypothetical protein
LRRARFRRKLEHHDRGINAEIQGFGGGFPQDKEDDSMRHEHHGEADRPANRFLAALPDMLLKISGKPVKMSGPGIQGEVSGSRPTSATFR